MHGAPALRTRSELIQEAREFVEELGTAGELVEVGEVAGGECGGEV